MPDTIFDNLWTVILDKQQSINKQADERFNKYYREREKSNRLIEESEKKYFQRIDVKNHDMEKLDERINRQLENNKFYDIKHHDEEEKKDTGRYSKIKAKNSTKEKTGGRYDNYNNIYEAINDADIEYAEKQALMEAVSNIQQRFAGQSDESS